MHNINYFKEIANSAFDINSNYSDEQQRHIRSVVMFSQIWGSSALGFKGIGCTAMYKAITTVVLNENGSADVYFAGKLAYIVTNVNEKFIEDMKNRAISSQDKVEKSKKYGEVIINEY